MQDAENTINELLPTSNFGAEEIRFLQKEATEWIAAVNAEIIKAAKRGCNEVRIDITHKNKSGEKFYSAPVALSDHFKERGFTFEAEGQSYVKVSW